MSQTYRIPKYYILYSVLWVRLNLCKIVSWQKTSIVYVPKRAHCLFHKCIKQLQSVNYEEVQWFEKSVWITNVQGLILPSWEMCTLCTHTNEPFYDRQSIHCCMLLNSKHRSWLHDFVAWFCNTLHYFKKMALFVACTLWLWYSI